jgi:hypothetical protein
VQWLVFDAELQNEAIEPRQCHSLGIQFLQQRAKVVLTLKRVKDDVQFVTNQIQCRRPTDKLAQQSSGPHLGILSSQPFGEERHQVEHQATEPRGQEESRRVIFDLSLELAILAPVAGQTIAGRHDVQAEVVFADAMPKLLAPVIPELIG